MPQCFNKLRPGDGETVGEEQEQEEGSRWGKGFMVERIRARQSATSLLGAQARAGVWPAADTSKINRLLPPQTFWCTFPSASNTDLPHPQPAPWLLGSAVPAPPSPDRCVLPDAGAWERTQQREFSIFLLALTAKSVNVSYSFRLASHCGAPYICRALLVAFMSVGLWISPRISRAHIS